MFAIKSRPDPSKKRAKQYLGLRKQLKRQARDEHGADVQWYGGILYFSKTLTEVPGVPHVPKPGCSAVGFRGAQPESPKRPSQRERQSSRSRVSGRNRVDQGRYSSPPPLRDGDRYIGL